MDSNNPELNKKNVHNTDFKFIGKVESQTNISYKISVLAQF